MKNKHVLEALKVLDPEEEFSMLGLSYSQILWVYKTLKEGGFDSNDVPDSGTLASISPYLPKKKSTVH